MVRKTSSSSPRHHKSPPDSHQCPGGRDSRLPHIHPRKQGVRGQVESTPVCACEPHGCPFLLGAQAKSGSVHSYPLPTLATSSLGVSAWLMATASPHRGRRLLCRQTSQVQLSPRQKDTDMHTRVHRHTRTQTDSSQDCTHRPPSNPPETWHVLSDGGPAKRWPSAHL